jgi:hypothetical protein
VTFVIHRSATGVVTRTCTPLGLGCPTGSW